MTVVTHNNTKGLVRAFDARSGKLLWTFNTIPRAGEFGNDTWENGSWATNGNTGVWTQMTVDEDLGLVYLPVESPTSDFYGGERPGNNLFGESLVCVDLKTGKRKWHFQIVHHPIWDYDLSSAPILADINVNGKAIKAVALPSSIASQANRSGRSKNARCPNPMCPEKRRPRRSLFPLNLPLTRAIISIFRMT
jgi:quinoprotein glucose dehydrogenase